MSQPYAPLESPEAIRHFFDAHVPPEFMRDTVKLLYVTYKEAYDESMSNFPEPVALDRYSYERRFMFERNWHNLCSRHEGVVAKYHLNAARNCSHIRVECGPIVLTVSAVNSPTTMVRRAMFRDTLANSNQPLLPGFETEPRFGNRLYGILIHGSIGWDGDKPEFAHIVFPDHNVTRYLGRIDLIQRFGIPEEVAPIPSPVVFAKKVAKKESSSS